MKQQKKSPKICMKAFFSAVDDVDEKATRLYAVVGKLDRYFPNIKVRISNGGKFLEIPVDSVFELIYDGYYPANWTENVEFRDTHNLEHNLFDDIVGDLE